MSDAFWTAFFLFVPQLLTLLAAWLTAIKAQRQAAAAEIKVAVLEAKVDYGNKLVNGGAPQPSDVRVVP